MDFGLPAFLGHNLEECAKMCRELGLRFAELSMDFPEYQPERVDIGELSRIAREYGIYYTVHLEGALNPWEINDRAAKAYTETVLDTIELAKRLAIPVLNMHFPEGDYITLPDRKVRLYEMYPEEFKAKLTAFRDVCTKAVGDSGITITVENTRSFMSEFVAEGVGLLLKSPVFGLAFDTGHDAAHGFRQFPLIERNIGRLRHMHLHDFSAERGDHLPLGEGTLDIERYLKLAEKHNCRVLLETKTPDGVRRSARYLKKLQTNEI